MKGVSVEIMGQQLTVASDNGDEWARTLAAAVDEKIKAIRASGQTVNSINLAILAALNNFADELERLRRDHAEVLSHLQLLNRRLSEAIGG
jgi:cell division protein ZapA (FtsZ GTPase activity inhibitor)